MGPADLRHGLERSTRLLTPRAAGNPMDKTAVTPTGESERQDEDGGEEEGDKSEQVGESMDALWPSWPRSASSPPDAPPASRRHRPGRPRRLVPRPPRLRPCRSRPGSPSRRPQPQTRERPAGLLRRGPSGPARQTEAGAGGRRARRGRPDPLSRQSRIEAHTPPHISPGSASDRAREELGARTTAYDSIR